MNATAISLSGHRPRLSRGRSQALAAGFALLIVAATAVVVRSATTGDDPRANSAVEGTPRDADLVGPSLEAFATARASAPAFEAVADHLDGLAFDTAGPTRPAPALEAVADHLDGRSGDASGPTRPAPALEAVADHLDGSVLGR